MPIEFLLVGIGGALGAVCRYVLSVVIKRIITVEFPVSTFVINLVGSFLLGLLLSLHMGSSYELLLGTGFMGGFTTFSTFQVENVTLYRNKQYKTLFLYAGSTCFFCILSAILGLTLGALVF